MGTHSSMFLHLCRIVGPVVIAASVGKIKKTNQKNLEGLEQPKLCKRRIDSIK